MSKNLAVKQKLIDKIKSLSEDQIINVLEFVDTLAKSKSNSEHLAHKSWQPTDPYDAIEKLTNLLETDKLSNSKKFPYSENHKYTWFAII